MLVQALDISINVLLVICLTIIVFSFINRIYVLFLYKRTLQIAEPQPSSFFSELPHVTIQLPVFNESSVVDRLINNICAQKYPHDKLEIQVLDDSTDETKDLVKRICEQKRAAGINIYQIHREQREGYKAGALQHGLTHAKGEFIAIFDSDFLPPDDFLTRTIHYFADQQIGWVQARWTHLNENFSLLTQCIALFCDSLFKVESAARSKLRHWGIFNGTAGIMRRSMIDEVDGWHWDTITEDSDISYRAQLLGWKYITLRETACPCELPPTLPVFLEQQIRWSKGNIQVIKKLTKRILSADVTVTNKYDFISYLTNYLCLPAVTVFSLLVLPMFLLNGEQIFWGYDVGVMIKDFSTAILGITFAVMVLFLYFRYAQNKNEKNNSYILYRTCMFIFLSIGLAPFITVAIFEGFFRNDKVFIRTPKFAISDESKHILANNSSLKLKKIALINVLMGIYCVSSFYIIVTQYYATSMRYIPLMLLFALAYSYCGFLIAFPNQKWLRNIFAVKPKEINSVEHSIAGRN